MTATEIHTGTPTDPDTSPTWRELQLRGALRDRGIRTYAALAAALGVSRSRVSQRLGEYMSDDCPRATLAWWDAVLATCAAGETATPELWRAVGATLTSKGGRPTAPKNNAEVQS